MVFVMRMNCLTVLWMAAAMGLSLPVLAKSPADHRAPVATSVNDLDAIRSQISAKENAALEAAVMGSYRMAVERFQDVRGLLKEERRLAESLLQDAASARDAPRIRGMLRENDAARTEVQEMISLLRVAIGPAQ